MKDLVIINAGHSGINPQTGHYETAPYYDINNPSSWNKSHYFKNSNTKVFEGEDNRIVANELKRYLTGMDVVFVHHPWKETPLMNISKKVNMLSKGKEKHSVFISLHANASPGPIKPNGSRSGHGWEIYSTTRKNNSDILAESILEYMRKSDMRIRGHKEVNFAEINFTNIPSVLIENYFFDNQKDRDKFFNNLEENIELIARGIYNYFLKNA